MSSKRMLEELFEDNVLQDQSPKKKKQKLEEVEENYFENISVSSDDSFDFYNNYNCYVILDPEAEEILQNLNDELFQQCFHFDKFLVRCLLMELHQRTYYHPMQEMRRCGLSFDMCVLVTLSYLMNGNFDSLDIFNALTNCSVYNFQKAVEHICSIIVLFLSTVYVRFPGTKEEQSVNKLSFQQKFGIPGVVAVLDYYHVDLVNVPEHEMHMYRHHRSLRPSIAVQVICDQNYCFLDVNPRFSGSTNKAYVWEHSHIYSIIKNSQRTDSKTWLVADRSYRLTTCVLNPYHNPTDILQETVNIALREVHNVAKKSFALLKARFRCLNSPLPFTHKNASNVITACVTLHNYLLAKGYPIDNLEYNIPKNKTSPNVHYEDDYSPEGQANREFVKNFMGNNSMQILYKMRKNSNITFTVISRSNHSSSK